MSFDFGSVDFEATDVSSDIETDPQLDSYGDETLTDSSDQVGSEAGNSDFVNETNPGSIDSDTTSTDPSGYQSEAQQLADGNGVTEPSAIDGLKDQAGALADKAKSAASGAFDKIQAQASSTLTKLENQFTAKNIEAFATKTAKSLVASAENLVINTAKNAANQALSTVVGPAAAATITGGVARSLTAPSTTSAKPVSSNTNPQANQSDDVAQLNADGSVNLSQFNKGPAALPTNYTGEAVTLQSDVPASEVDKSAANVGYSTAFNEENGTYSVVNNKTGQAVATGLSEQQAMLQAQDQTFIDAGESQPPATANVASAGTAVNYTAPTSVSTDVNPQAFVGPPSSLANAGSIATAALESATSQLLNDATRALGLTTQARLQQTVRAQRQNQAQAGDWRVRLRLAPQSNYLYNAPDCGPLLWPLRNTDGVIFPYTPSIDTTYKANYNAYDLTHSNYRGYFYQNSYIDGINLKATFTAQDTAEANYLLAVIHFFRSATKMFYGQDAERGTPPPLTYLSGLGDFQFNEHPCVISQFNYNLPSDVNYIRAQSTVTNGTNLLNARQRQTVLGNPLSYAIQRLSALGQGINPGALDAPFAPQGSLGAANPTYVPTKMEISLVLLPIQSRSQVSQVFSLKGFANGNLLKGGFW